MPKFAVYYIPEKSAEIYRLGSSIVGYDVRKQKSVETLKELREIPGYNDKWVEKARPYGFHLTITDSIDFHPGDLAMITQAVNDILGCFKSEHKFILHHRRKRYITPWGPAIVLQYDPNDHLKVLHSVLVACLHPLGTGSGYLQRFIEDNKKEAIEPYRVQRILKFYSPTIFDSYSPHFTLLNPYTGDNLQEIINFFTDKFKNYEDIELHSVCLLVQMNEGENWCIYKEFEII